MAYKTYRATTKEEPMPTSRIGTEGVVALLILGTIEAATLVFLVYNSLGVFLFGVVVLGAADAILVAIILQDRPLPQKAAARDRVNMPAE